MNRTAYVKLALVLFGFAALLAAFDDDGFVPALAGYSFQLMILVLAFVVFEGFVAPWMRRRLGVRGRSRAGSSHHSGDGSIGGGSDCGWSDSGWSDSGGGGDGGGGGDSGGSC